MIEDIRKCDDTQRKAVMADTGRNILVSASAGAGKTRVLVTRILKRCIEDRVPINRILALTFTEAAAQEMKNRLSQRLHELLAKSTDEEERKYLESQISALSAAYITTIDSFCLNLIRRYGSAAGLNPACSSHVLSEPENELYFRLAFEEVLTKMIETEKENAADFFAAFAMRSEDYDRVYAMVRRIILQSYCAEDPMQWYAKAQEVYPDSDDVNDIPEAVTSVFLESLQVSCESMCALLKDMADLAHKEYPSMEATYAKMLYQAKDCLSCLEDGMESYEEYRRGLIRLAEIKNLKPKHDALAAKRELMNRQMDVLLSDSFSVHDLMANSRTNAKRARFLLSLALNTQKKAEENKMKDACIDFADMERYALQILNSNDVSCIDEIVHAFDEIMIDEFQDTSILQDAILRKVAGNAPIFRVGDVKQSIYRFRQAKPDMFRNLLKDEENNTVIRMLKNYRSDQKIIAFTNLLFSRLMNVSRIPQSYGEEDTVTIGTDRQISDDAPHVHLSLIATGSDKKLPGSIVKDMKARWIANQIHILMFENPDLHYRDFAILTRSHGDQIVITRMLEAAGIPADADLRDGFFKSDMCLLIKALYQCMLSKRDQVALMTVLHSEMFGFSDEEIAQMILSSRKDPAQKSHSLSDCTAFYHPEVFEVIDQLHQILRNSGVMAMLQKLAVMPVREDFCFYEALSLQDRANFDYYSDLCASLQNEDIHSLLSQIELGEDEKSSQASVAGRDDDLVRTVTIHGSKGLEYPYVFLWGTGSERSMSASGDLMTDDTLMIAFNDNDTKRRSIMPTMQRLAMEYRNEIEELAEYIRVFYVAATRAVKHLYIVDVDNNAVPRQNITPTFLRLRTGMTGLITAAMDHEAGITENGLLEVTYDMTTPLIQSEKTEKAALPLARLNEKKLLPESRTPSSYEGEDMSFILPDLDANEGGASYGTKMHEAMETMAPYTEWSIELIHSLLPDLNESECERLMLFDSTPIRQYTKKMTVYPEHPFYYEDETIRLHGTIDYLAVNDTETVIIDYKTDRKTVEQLKEAYTVQLMAYAKAVRALYPDHQCSVYIYSLYNSCEIRIL